jgi:hypothetical protein
MMRRPFFYRLVGKLTVPCGDDAVEWSKMWTDDTRFVAQDYIGDTFVSTIFNGLDANYMALINGDDDAPPILFETMIFPTDLWQYQTRCSTWDQAINMHNSAVAHARKVLRQLPVPMSLGTVRT